MIIDDRIDISGDSLNPLVIVRAANFQQSCILGLSSFSITSMSGLLWNNIAPRFIDVLEVQVDKAGSLNALVRWKINEYPQ
jgi:hypothetical protein